MEISKKFIPHIIVILNLSVLKLFSFVVVVFFSSQTVYFFFVPKSIFPLGFPRIPGTNGIPGMQGIPD